jgi:hypothetical protein
MKIEQIRAPLGVLAVNAWNTLRVVIERRDRGSDIGQQGEVTASNLRGEAVDQLLAHLDEPIA